MNQGKVGKEHAGEAPCSPRPAQEKESELREAALGVLPILERACEFIPYGSEEGRAYTRFRKALDLK